MDTENETNQVDINVDPDEREVPEQEKEFARRLLKQIKTRFTSPRHKRHLADIKVNRRYAEGLQDTNEGDNAQPVDEDGVVRANIIHPELKKSLNECYAKNPEVAIKPREAVDDTQYDLWKAMGRTMEVVLNHEMSADRANLKAKAKRAVRSADTTGFGWMKVVFQTHIEKDPIIVNRMEDIQNNIQTIDRLVASLEKDDSVDNSDALGEKSAEKEELEQTVKALEAEVEVRRSSGVVYEVRPSENVLFSDDPQDLDDIAKAGWITDIVWMKVSTCKEKFKFCPNAALRYGERSVKAEEAVEGKPKELDDDDKLVRVFEMWRMADKQIYTLVEGYNGYLKPPFAPRKVGERFHAFFPLAFDPVDGSPYPNPLVTQLKSLQDEHTTTYTNFREHRERAVPFSVIHGSRVDPKEADAITNPKFMETIALKSIPEGMPLSEVFTHVAHPPLDPNVYGTQHIREAWEQITRRSDASRGTVAKSKTATEADILQSNMAVDTSERQDVVEDWFRDIAQYTLELCLQEMNEAEVKRIAGPAAQWPAMRKEEVFDLVGLGVRVGSSGKPDAGRELDRWTKMLPQLRESLLAIADMQEAGKDEPARILTQLLRETLERFEERIDLNALLPKKEKGEDPAKAQANQMKQTQIALQMKEMISNIANVDADTMKKVAEAEAKESGPQMQIYMTVLQGLLNNQQQQQQPGASNGPAIQ